MADVPAGTGLGSSGSFLVALLKALHAYKGEDISAKKLAEEAADIEMNILNEPIGKQDQYISAFGGVLNLEIEKNGNVIVSTIDSSYSTMEELENNLLLFSTGIKHSAVEVISDQKKNLESDEKKMDQMHIVKEIGMEIRSALEKGDTSKVGKWFNVHWESKKRFSKKMTSPKIDAFYELGIKNGATGGKLVGAGGGGFILFYCEKNKVKLRNAMKKVGLKEMPFRFDSGGCKIIYQGR